MSGTVSFSGPGQAIGLARAALGYLAAAGPVAMPAGSQAECLLGLEQVTAMATAAHAAILGAFGCRQPAHACQVHHVRHKADGGHTSVKDCILLCPLHYLVCIHRQGWTLAVNPDGTTTAWNPDKTKVHSHGLPTARAANPGWPRHPARGTPACPTLP